MTTGYGPIAVGGGDTTSRRNLERRVEIVAEHCRLAGARLLDAGCGAGGYVEAYAAAGADACGLEFDAAKVAAWASAHPGDSRVQQGDLARQPYADASFDVVVLNEVLEHVPDEVTVLREIARVLVPGGVLLVFSPNRRYPFETHGAHSQRTGSFIAPIRTLGLPYLPLTLANRLVRPTARNYWPHTLRALVRDAGFDIIHTDYVWQTFEGISGHQPALVTRIAPVLRAVAAALSRTPLVRSLGASQIVVARR